MHVVCLSAFAYRLVRTKECAHKRYDEERRMVGRASGGSHGSGCLFGIPPPAAVKAHVLKNHHARLQVDRCFGSQTPLASLAALYVGCSL